MAEKQASKRGFPFAFAVELLSKAEETEQRYRDRKIKERERSDSLEHKIQSWFSFHSQNLEERLIDPSALFSMLFPKHRTDRVYGYKFGRLYKALPKWLHISRERAACLAPDAWVRSFSDYGAAVEKVMKEAENPVPDVDAEDCVTVEEVDRALDNMGSRSKFSNGRVRGKNFDEEELDAVVGGILRRLSSEQAKWFVRIVLKEDKVVDLPVSFTLKQYHFLLPHIYSVQHDLQFAFETLKTPVLRYLPSHPDPIEYGKLLEDAAKQIKPKVGVQIQLPEFIKARGLKDAVRRMGSKKVYMERKYDGEYCQVHIDLQSKINEGITIFSKSGRDSTEDRRKLWKAIKEGLRLDSKARKIESTCILEGEMFVYDEAKKEYMDFSEIRKHVPRAGRYIGTEDDIKPDYKTQHLMIVFFDVLYHDSTSLISTPFHKRIKLLEELVTVIPGLCELPKRYSLDFSIGSQEMNIKNVAEIFKRGIAERYEGYVLKPYNSPYIGFGLNGNRHHWVKLKKDYINGLGDTMDVCIIGACHDPKRALEMKGITPSTFTSFHVAFCHNKAEAQRTGKRIFFTVDVVTHNIPENILRVFNNHFRVKGIDYKDYMNADIENKFDIKTRGDMPVIQKVIPEPFVVEIAGGSFHKQSNCNYQTLRWPRFVKWKEELSWADAADFRDLQIAAMRATSVPEENLTQEADAWGDRLIQSAMPKKRKHAEAISPPRPFPQPKFASSPVITKPRFGTPMGKSMWEFGGQSTQGSVFSRQSTEERETEDSPRLEFMNLLPNKGCKQHRDSETLLETTDSDLVDITLTEQQAVEENVNGGNSTQTVTMCGSPNKKSKDVINVVGTSDPLPKTSSAELPAETTPFKRRRLQPPVPASPCLSSIDEDGQSDDDLVIISHNIITPPTSSYGMPPVTTAGIKCPIPRRPLTPPTSSDRPTTLSSKVEPVVIDLDPEPYMTPHSSPPIPNNPFTNAEILLGSYMHLNHELEPLLKEFNVRTVQTIDSFLEAPSFERRKILLMDQRMLDPAIRDIHRLLGIIRDKYDPITDLPRVDVYCWRGFKEIGVDGMRLDGKGKGDWDLFERVSIP
ncbi:hypothetical protein BJ508DRAFT_412221 [Ascobolus immersus RN42]|uniref:ATP-dependent DNA ligase family profile domain-containing protein n=1 Tax=Ascobolus immersus RN42 TaxID=1160509 RepID=A0A3N4ILL3_ASCIM|nr:hypothetical protein BJ508DRAFT_412221 [Ascobolus immersus RN42]